MASLRTVAAACGLALGMLGGLNAGIAAADASSRNPSDADNHIDASGAQKGYQPRLAKRAQGSVAPEPEADTLSPQELWRQAREDGLRLSPEELRRVWTWSQYVSKP